MARGGKPAVQARAGNKPAESRPAPRAALAPAKPGRFAAFRQRLAAQSTQQATSANFLRESYAELRKVHWPTREETTRMTIIVIAFSLASGVVLGGMDFLYAKLIALLVGA